VGRSRETASVFVTRSPIESPIQSGPIGPDCIGDSIGDLVTNL
jgi:hypothetical protein